MAILTKNTVSGIVGGVIFSNRKGQVVITAKPRTVRQSAATKSCSPIFGEAEFMKSVLIRKFNPDGRKFHDPTMHLRLKSMTSKILYASRVADSGEPEFRERTFKALEGFNFNKGSLLEDSLPASPGIRFTSSEAVITINDTAIASKLLFPPGAFFCSLKVTLACLRPAKREYAVAEESRSAILKPGQQLDGPVEYRFQLPPGTVCLIGVALDFYRPAGDFQVLLNSRSFNPSAISAVFLTPGNDTGGDGRKWRKY